ncbi:desmoglein-3-like [Plectropomus leopardus]|uniref:desmoglein-3-like n=1 Tax=Plectropomus leopardus TaxID=160734 RepID=UPI001C4D3D3E|nr:desmoglein-3-like [Plectropomus leopardus]
MTRLCSPVFALLVFAAVTVVIANPADTQVRRKREWIIPPTPLEENVDDTKKEWIAKIRSDFESEADIIYSLKGVGASEEPYDVFKVDPKTGYIRVTRVLDREEIDTYNLLGVAKYNDGTNAEKEIKIRIEVKDQNDNDPVFGVIKAGQVNESSSAGTAIMKIKATDADKKGTPHSQIFYSIVNVNPPHDLFYMGRDGTVFVKSSALDRERADKYVLTVQGQDLNGEPGGRVGTGSVTINVLDINDNAPTLEKEEYEASIMENTQNVEVMRIKAQDLDLQGTANWEAVYEIVRGNEAGYFSIMTDSKTNEGILMLNKALNYEDVRKLNLGLYVRNKAPLIVNGVTHAHTDSNLGLYKLYQIKVNVTDQREGPHFDPKSKSITIAEGGSFSSKEVIGVYRAIDQDTGKAAENVRYVKGWDPDNWLYIDPKTAEIRLNKEPDRESSFLVNGTYKAEVICITEDMPTKTATGTVLIEVKDLNDQCPTLTSSIQTACIPKDSVIVTAKDEDAFPHGPPFEFTIIPEGTQGKWHFEHYNDTAAILRSNEKNLWPGIYEVTLEVKDQQGVACPEPQKVTVHVCTCEEGVTCRTRKIPQSELGPAAIGLLFLGLLLLALLLLALLFCQCGGDGGLPGDFAKMPFETKSHLINYHTEGQGENTAVPLLILPTTDEESGGKKDIPALPLPGFKDTLDFPSIDRTDEIIYSDFAHGHSKERWDVNQHIRGGGIFDGMALSDHFLGQYYSQKVNSVSENLGVRDGLLVYDYEGQSSPVGSVGCCSLLEADNDLQFLDDLGPKFKTLAEVCGGKRIPTEVKPQFTPLPSTSINTQTSVSSLMTTQQLPPLPKLQPSIPETVVRETSECSQVVKESTATVREGMTTVKEGMANSGQVLLLQPPQQQQQPVYYTTAPVLQPVQYVVQPQVQNTLLLAESPATNLQGMVLVNGTQTGPAQSVVVQGQTVMSSGQAKGPNIVLVEGSQVQGGSANLIQTGNLPGSQTMMVVEGKVPVGSVKVLGGSQTSVVQGSALQQGGSQRVLVVGGPTGNGGQLFQQAGGLSQKNSLSGFQKVFHNKGSTSQGNLEGSSMTTVTPTYQKVVVQETREIVK